MYIILNSCYSFCIIKLSKFTLVKYFWNSSTMRSVFQIPSNPAISFSDKKKRNTEMPLKLLVYSYSFCIIKLSKFALVEYFWNGSTMRSVCFISSNRQQFWTVFNFKFVLTEWKVLILSFFVTIAKMKMPLNHQSTSIFLFHLIE